MQETVHFRGAAAATAAVAAALDAVVAAGGTFEIAAWRSAKDGASAVVAAEIGAADVEALDRVLAAACAAGAEVPTGDARFTPAEADGILPDDFYSTSNEITYVRVDGRWTLVAEQKMDCALVLRTGVPTCVKQRKVRRGEPVLVGAIGVRVRAPARATGGGGFGFMSQDVSAELDKDVKIRAIAAEMRRARAAGRKTVVVAGPAIVHSGGERALAESVRRGFVDVLLAGNAFAVHDLEKALCGTSLGVCAKSGRPVPGGSRNHLLTINRVNRAGGVAAAVRAGLVRRGVMYELVTRGAPFVLAGSIRDDGPLRDVITDALAAQDAYVEALRGAGVCLLLATTLHAIAVGNLLSAEVFTACVDMTESTPTKLANRGTTQAVGLVTDVGYFLERLNVALRDDDAAAGR
jgi:lysine-ketoglutarate reductase/saccharopine dehydrogenase-like protein (TIGR00300 family)